MCIHIKSRYPCGRCPECLSKKRSDWSIRLQEEWFEKKVAYHAILTYDEKHLPKSPAGLATFSKDDCQKFLKRLRHKFETPITFFLATEYGEFSLRPHVHIVLFGVPKFDDIVIIKHRETSEKMRSLVESAWQNGFVRYLSCYVSTTAQLHYLTKDIVNEASRSIEDNLYYQNDIKPSVWNNFLKNTYFPYLRNNKVDDRLNSFRLMSKGLGLGYVNNFLEVHHLDYEVINKYELFFKSRFGEDRKMFSCPSGFSPCGEYYVKNEFLYTLKFDLDGNLIIPDDLLGYIHDYKTLLLVKEDGLTKQKSATFALPRYYKKKIYSYGINAVQSLYYFYKQLNKRQSYDEQFKEYDSEHKKPYYLLSAEQKYEFLKRKHKDKYIDLLHDKELDDF